jgi:hypothetical protein
MYLHNSFLFLVYTLISDIPAGGLPAALSQGFFHDVRQYIFSLDINKKMAGTAHTH